MYKIYFGNKALWLVTDETNALRQSHRALLVRYTADQRASLHEYISLLLQEKDSPDAIILQTTQVESLFQSVASLFYLQEAAGGLVYNEQQQLLAIFRRGCWDLAKGKIDAGETAAQAAVREVQEETGISQVELGAFIGCTYHVFSDRVGRRTLKKTHWWAMTAPTQPLVPQLEEDIEEAVWMAPAQLLRKTPIYANILEIIHQHHPDL